MEIVEYFSIYFRGDKNNRLASRGCSSLFARASGRYLPWRCDRGIYESYGRGWLIKPDYVLDKNLKMGDWNTMRIIVKGNRVQTFLNDTPMVDFSDTKIGKGKGSIALQIHSGGGIKVRWRNLNIKNL